MRRGRSDGGGCESGDDGGRDSTGTRCACGCACDGCTRVGVDVMGAGDGDRCTTGRAAVGNTRGATCGEATRATGETTPAGVLLEDGSGGPAWRNCCSSS